ncbi:ABC transporter permease [Nocardia sp. NPDC020380]|uniref:ABC transporter permease n=1 Tax=Nocardia sp. NPDC020380 TaxID=3364309 RepID=UPI0037B305C1
MRGRHEQRHSISEWFARFRSGPYLPATVLVFIIAAAAALFAGSYTYTMAKPTPRDLPIGVVDPLTDPPVRTFLADMDHALNDALTMRHYATAAQARDALEAQEIFTIVDKDSAGIEVSTASASGASVAELLAQTAQEIPATTAGPVRVQDLIPLQSGDPRGLGLFYITLAAGVVGMMGGVQLTVHAAALKPLERIAFTAAYAIVGGLAVIAVVDWGLHVIRLRFPESLIILSLTMFCAGMVFTMFNTLFGRWAMIPTWLLIVVLGNPSSGGAVSWPLLPTVLGVLGRWLPPGASMNAQHTAVYFRGHQHREPFLVLAGWIVLSCTVFLWVQHRRSVAAAAAEAAVSPS